MSETLAVWPSFVTLVVEESFRVFDEFDSVSSFACGSNFWTVPVSCLLLLELEEPGVVLEAVEPLDPVPMSDELPDEPLVPLPIDPELDEPVPVEPVESLEEPVPMEPDEPEPVLLPLPEPIEPELDPVPDEPVVD